MSKDKQGKSAKKNKKPLIGWDAAVYDAEQKIEKHEQRIAGLKMAIRNFKSLKEQGEPFPAELTQQKAALK